LYSNTIRILKAKLRVRKSEKDILLEGIRKFGSNGYNATLANGVPATVLRGENICRIEPNGAVSIVGKMNKSIVKSSQKTFRLK